MESTALESPTASGAATPLAHETTYGTDPLQHESIPQDQPCELAADLLAPGSPINTDENDAPSESQHAENISRLLKGKEREWKTAAEKHSPLSLLDLPVDILKEIIHQLPHTNDLTSLALCHSALHRLAIPYIYSRFDIVWPDASTHTEPRSGVDALTYGLATLVMAEDVFGEAPYQQQSSCPDCKHTHKQKLKANLQHQPYPLSRQRRGNYYAQFTKKFSLGNGPADWVQEYLITKEGGKMLGTLVALAVARMKSLETFVWDMPTGILRDVWLALSALADRGDPESCRLERVWIRWHDNSLLDGPVGTAQAPQPPMPLSNIPPPPNLPHTSGATPLAAPVVMTAHASHAIPLVDRIEHPTFSVLPALKSLSVLDIDELPYLDEMSILVARSRPKLRELRVGIARHAQQRDWVTAWEGDAAHQVDYNSTCSAVSPTISDKRLGGVLGVLVGRVYNMRRNAHVERALAEKQARKDSSAMQTPKKGQASSSSIQQVAIVTDRESQAHPMPDELTPTSPKSPTQVNSTSVNEYDAEATSPSHSVENVVTTDGTESALPYRPPQTIEASCEAPGTIWEESEQYLEQQYGPDLRDRLRLDTLELERVPLSVNVLLKAFDWTILTTLTLLHCHNHEALWKSLRRNFSPRVGLDGARSHNGTQGFDRGDYRLNLKKIHTNAVSPSLISFLKETLAPNSLEVLFLQEGRSYSSNVTVDAIYKGPIRRHRSSLKKLMIDSSEKGPDGHALANSRWRRWMVNQDILTFITSGRMTSLRELAITIDYRYWHYFLQRIPFVPHLRSLYIPNIADHAHGNNIDPKELALQVVDIVHLRPEIEICYMGILSKCFEILENKSSNYEFRQDIGGSTDGAGGASHHGFIHGDPLTSDDEGEETEEEDDDDLDGPSTGMDGEDDSESETSDDDHDDSDGDDSYLHDDDRKGPRLKLREILFYDDKVAIFKARHGRL